MSLDAGEIIYKAFVPTLKMALCIAAGFVLTKTGSLLPDSIRGISLITLNLSLPCLVFSSMVKSFTPATVQAFGPLLMIGIMYQVMGGLLAWVMGIVSNWGNLPTAVVQTMAREAPFNPETDVDLGVAYIAIFILLMNSVFFALGVHRMCGWDFAEDRRVSNETFKQRWSRRLSKLQRCLSRCRGNSLAAAPQDGSVGPGRPKVESKTSLEQFEGPAKVSTLGRMTSQTLSSPPTVDSTKRIPATLPTVEDRDVLESPFRSLNATPTPQTFDEHDDSPSSQSDGRPLSMTSEKPVARPMLLVRAVGIIQHVPMATWSVVAGLLCSLIQPLKALLTTTESWTGSRMPNAPDGNPPLFFLLDTTAYLGALTVPLGLMLLGSSFARLQFPSRLRDAPIAATIAMAVTKMIILPVLAVFLVQAFQSHTSLFPKEDKVRTFCAILLSGTPAAVNQLVVTQLYNPAGRADTLSFFLLLQYSLMFVLSTALAAIALYIVK
ncbi:hypothetical protein CspHIS471_0209650 [Cutaneotrichosporon sp. HIS471]|nr:hypothetical protein CspHIS471_0209650 [Cutaneotrichosporon sp. HIS471]